MTTKAAVILVNGSCKWLREKSTMKAIMSVEREGQREIFEQGDTLLWNVLTGHTHVSAAAAFVQNCWTSDRMVIAKLVGIMSKDELSQLNTLTDKVVSDVNVEELGNSGHAALVVHGSWVTKVEGEFIREKRYFKVTKSSQEDLVEANDIYHALEVLDVRVWPELEQVMYPQSINTNTKRSLRI